MGWIQAAAALGLLLAGVGLGVGVAVRALRRRDARFREARSALLESEARLRWAIDATSEIVWDWDLVRDTIYHPSWAHTYGFPEEKTPRTGAELVPFIHPEDMPRFQDELRKAVEGSQEAFEVEHRALTGTGDWKWILGRARVVARGPDGRATRVVGTCTDVTEKKKMATQLRIADRMASIGTLAAGVAHEINTPLASVLANLEFSLERLDGGRAGGIQERVQECLAALQDARMGGQRMRDIVRDVQSFSRVEDEERTPVRVEDALRAAITLADHEIRTRARLSLDVRALPEVHASESRLSQVFLNLLVNAAQAIPEGDPDRHEIRVVAREHHDGRVAVEIADTGCGIPPELRQRIFDPFFTTKAPGVGTGLGLSICHGIVAGAGGQIEVESEVGRGTTFRVLLPALDARRTPGAEEEPGTSRPSRRGGAVALVGD